MDVSKFTVLFTGADFGLKEGKEGKWTQAFVSKF